jgi:hypothetical protein
MAEPMLGTDVAGLAAGPFVAACSLLVIAGAGKIARPNPTRAAALAAGWNVPVVAVSAFGVVEVGTGIAGIGFGRGAALAVAAVYVVLGAFAFRLVRRAPSTPCACLGTSSAPASRVHVVVNLAAVAIAIAAASGGTPLEGFGSRPFAAVLFVALVASCVALVALAFDSLSALGRAVKEGAS